MIAGIGTDIIEVERIKNAILRNNSFVQKLFTDKEIEYLKKRKMRPEFAAGRFAAKEAVSKSLGIGFRGFGTKDIEIDNDELGKPFVILHGKADDIAAKYSKDGKYKIHLSISHTNNYAAASAILEVC